MANEFTIHFDNPMKIDCVHLTIGEDQEIVLENHTDTKVDIEPGWKTIRAVYSIDSGGNFMEMDRTIQVYIDPGFDYMAKVCLILKSFSLLKIYPDGMVACC